MHQAGAGSLEDFGASVKELRLCIDSVLPLYARAAQKNVDLALICFGWFFYRVSIVFQSFGLSLKSLICSMLYSVTSHKS